jgi:alkanesulfonate monooxygenase SsuD/methylene tetrahydromethanopterin reductase-like flavin-dependent oxidoreductase (luciferase family)
VVCQRVFGEAVSPPGEDDWGGEREEESFMDIAMTLPTMLPHGRRELIEWCREADAGTFSSLAVPERTTYQSHDCVVQLAAAAALTENVALWTTIVILPAHDAVDTAKKMMSIDVLCNGRLTIGVGVGGRAHDYRALGAPFTRRWHRMDEQVATMRRVWRGEPLFDGADPVGPLPVQNGGPRIIAGSMGPKSIGRAARWADGVVGWTLDGDQAQVRAAFDMVIAAWHEAGRTEPPHLSTSIWYALGDGAEARLRSYAYDYLKIFGEDAGRYGAGGVVCYTEDALRRTVDDIRAAGADELFLVPTTADPRELERTTRALQA